MEMIIMNTKEIAKLLRKELKDEFDGEAKFSVRCVRGNKILVTIKEANESMFISEKEFEQEHLYEKLENPVLYKSLKEQFDNYEINRFNKNCLELIEIICNQYNNIESDPYTDYYRCDYYLSIVSGIE